MGQTDRSQRGEGWGDWTSLAKEHTFIYAKPMDTDNNIMKAGGGGAGCRRAKEGTMGDISNSVNNKILKRNLEVGSCWFISSRMSKLGFCNFLSLSLITTK